METQEIEFQLVPHQTHRCNDAVHAIHTFKNHLISGLCSTDENFPLNFWDKLFPLCLITLNLLCGSCVNPKLSTYDQFYNVFYFNFNPLAPPRNRFLGHERPAVQGTWEPHAIYVWFVGPYLNHYRNFTV